MKFHKLRMFLPSKDYELSKAFYHRLGFVITWESEDLTIMTYGDIEFFLQKFYVKAWAENTMFQLFVDNIVEFYAFIERLKQEFPSIRFKPIQQEDYGTTFHLLDPSGVLLHIMQHEG